MSKTKSTNKNNKKVVLLTAISALLTAVLVLSGVGIYLKVAHKEKNPIVEVNPLDFSIDTWDGSVEAINFNENYAGRGTKTKTINSAASFAHFIQEVNNGNTYEGYTIYLNSSIDLNGQTISSIGTSEHPFKGTFDGGHYTIYNAKVNGKGLFGVTEDATIKNIGLYNANTNLIDKAVNTNIENCFVRLGNGNLANEYISNNGNHHIKNSFVDSDAQGLVTSLNTNHSNENRVLIEESYFNLGQKAIVELAEESFVTEERVIKPNSKSDFEDWGYSAEYDATMEWSDYDYLEGSKKLDFNLPVQSGFVKTYLTGSCYESVMIAGETVIDTTNLAEAFTEADKTQEAEVNLLVEKIFMEAQADLVNADVKVNAIEDTTIVRGEHNQDSMFVASGTSKIVIGKEKDAVSTVSSNEQQDAKIVLDGNKEYIEENNLESGSLVVAYGGTVEIHDNVELKNNINNKVKNGGAVLLYNTEEQSIVDADISGCTAIENGGGICAVGVAPETIGSINNCHAINGGGGAMALIDELESDETIEQMHTLYGKKMTIRPTSTTITTSSVTLTAGASYSKNSGSYGGAYYIQSPYGRLKFPSTYSESDPTEFTNNYATGTTTITGTGYLDSNKNLAGLGGAILYYKHNFVESDASGAYAIKNTKFGANYAANGAGGAVASVQAAHTTVRFIYLSSNVWMYNNYAKYGGSLASIRDASSYAAATFNLSSAAGFGHSGWNSMSQVKTTYGGAIYTSGNLVLGSCKFETCGATAYGGAILVEDGIGDTTITGGTFTGCSAPIGGAIMNYNTTTISSSTFKTNSATNNGGAISSYYYLNLENCSFTSNTATNYGGAIRGSYITKLKGTNIFKSNQANYGGAIATNGSITTDGATGIFTSNSAGTSGGAIYLYSDSAATSTLGNCSFTSNNAKYGGAIRATSTNYLIFTSCDFSSNQASGDGSGGAVRAEGKVDLTDCSFGANSTTNAAVGSGAILSVGDLTLYGNCSFWDNSGGKYGGAICCDAILTVAEGATVALEDNRVTDGKGTGIYCGHQPIYVYGTISQNGMYYTDSNHDTYGMSLIWAEYGIEFNTDSFDIKEMEEGAHIGLGSTGIITKVPKSAAAVINVYKPGIKAYNGEDNTGVLYTTATVLSSSSVTDTSPVNLTGMPSWGHIDYNKIVSKTAVITPLTWYSTSPSAIYGSTENSYSFGFRSSVIGSYTWTSSDTSIVEPYSTSSTSILAHTNYWLKYSAKTGEGTATVTVTFIPGDTSLFSKAVTKITLKMSKASTSVTISENPTEIVLDENGSSVYIFKYKASRNGTVSITSSNTSVATIVSGYTTSVSANSVYSCEVNIKSMGSTTLRVNYAVPSSDSSNYKDSSSSFKLRVGAKINYDYAGGNIVPSGIENVSGAQYGFALQSDGYYQPVNTHMASSYALTKFTFTATSTATVFEVIYPYASTTLAYAIFSDLNQTLSASISADSTYKKIYKSTAYLTSSPDQLTYTTTPGETYTIYIKYGVTSSSVYPSLIYLKFKIKSGAVINQSHYFADTPAFTLNNPTREGYTFTGWTGSNGTTPSTSVTVAQGTNSGVLNYTANWEQTTHQITWVDYDGSTLRTDTVAYGDTPSYGSTPTRASTAQYTYTFTGWSPSVVACAGNATYTAQYAQTLRTYTITWKHEDGTTLETDVNIPYGTMPSYEGAEPSKATTVQYTYSFNGWDPEVSTVAGDATYTAKFIETLRSYVVTWKHEDGTIIKTDTVAYGSTPNYIGDIPTKESTSAETYTFAGWDSNGDGVVDGISSVTGDIAYTAVFSTTVTAFTITWVNEDGTVLETDNSVPYGNMPSYNGATPTKAQTPQYTYTFAGWAPEITEVTGFKTYTATYTSELRSYTITINLNNSSYGSLQSSNNKLTFTVQYGQEITIEDNKLMVDGVTVTALPNSSSTQYEYVLENWSGASDSVIGDMEITANIVEEVKKYTVSVVSTYDNQSYNDEMSFDVAYGTQIYVEGNVLTIGDYHYVAIPLEDTLTHTYSFVGFTNASGTIDGEKQIIATFAAAPRVYAVSVVSDDTTMGTVTVSAPINSNYGTEIKIVGNVVYVGSTPITATAKEGYEFVRWEGGVGLVNGSLTIRAIFAATAEAPSEIIE